MGGLRRGKSAGAGGGLVDHYATSFWLVGGGLKSYLYAVIADGRIVWPEATKGDWEVGKAYEEGDTVHLFFHAWDCTDDHTSDVTNGPWQAGSQWEMVRVNRSDVSNPFIVTVAGHGELILYWGTADQVLDDSVPEYTATHHPYRNDCVFMLKDWLHGRERESVPDVKLGLGAYPDQSVITGDPALPDQDDQCNPLAIVAQVATHPILGLGADASRLIDSESWQAVADVLLSRSATTYLSVEINDDESFRSFADRVASYYDGWFRWNREGKLEAGLFPRSTQPPDRIDALTVLETDLCEELSFSPQTWADVSTQVALTFSDRERGFKANGVTLVNDFAVQASTGDRNEESVERLWITRPAQAVDVATEMAKVMGEPGILNSTIAVRSERTAAIIPGTRFHLQDGADFILCRCIGRKYSEPPGKDIIRFESERGLSLAIISDAARLEVPDAKPDPEVITLYQFCQLPPALAGGADYRIALLAARTSRVSTGLTLFLRYQAPIDFYPLGDQSNWSIAGTLEQDYADTNPALSVLPPDDDSETLHVMLDPDTVELDLAKISATQTDDTIAAGQVCVFVFSAGNPHLFEVMVLKAIRIVGGDDFYRLKVRRARFGSVRRSFTTGDPVMMCLQSDITPYYFAQIPQAALDSGTVTFRIASKTPWETADVTDTAFCPDVPYTFFDPNAPEILWTAAQYRTGAGASWVDITDFSITYLPTYQFRLVARVTDSTADLRTITVSATAGILSSTIVNSVIAGAAVEREMIFSLTDGDWDILAVVTDSTGRRTVSQLTEPGDPDEVVLRVQIASPVKVANPTVSPIGGYIPTSRTVTITCSTVSPVPVIHYQIVFLGAGIGSWTTYTVPVSVSPNHTLYAYASASGLTDSIPVRHDYPYRDPDLGTAL